MHNVIVHASNVSKVHLNVLNVMRKMISGLVVLIIHVNVKMGSLN